MNTEFTTHSWTVDLDLPIATVLTQLLLATGRNSVDRFDRDRDR